ncbi:MAG: BON domain-containing protein [Planctomycetes bacterium]|nr:BON domain-containing protein [Planctomycetota bacterium]
MTTAAATLEDRVDSAISRVSHLMDKVVRIETHAGHVVLRGVVGSYYQKQLAQEAVRTVDGVAGVENQLEVCWPSMV